MARIKLQYVNEYIDRHGKVRRYVRVPGSRGVKLPGLPGSVEFMAAYQAAIATVAPPPPSSKHVIHGSLAEITAGYFRSAAFANLSEASQQLYRRALKPVLEAHGHRLVREMPKAAARNIIEAIGESRPGAANLTRAALSKVMVYAISTGVREDNPFTGLERYRLGTHHTWTEAEIAQFERRWPLGTRERKIRVSQQKTRKGTTNELMITIHPALARALQAGPVVGMHHLLTKANGRPLRGISKFIERAVARAGLPEHCVAHGLRQGWTAPVCRERRHHQGDRRDVRAPHAQRD